jgi:glycolate oxidase
MAYNKVDERIVSELRQIVGADDVLVDGETMEPYTHDETVGLSAQPEVVVRARSAEAVSAVMRLAQRERVPVTPRGAGVRRDRALAGQDEPHPRARQGEPDAHRRAGSTDG